LIVLILLRRGRRLIGLLTLRILETSYFLRSLLLTGLVSLRSIIPVFCHSKKVAVVADGTLTGKTVHCAERVRLLEVPLLLKDLILAFQPNVLLKLDRVHLKHAEEWVLAVLVLPQQDFLLVFQLVELSPFRGALLGHPFFKQSFLFVVLFGFAAPFLFKRLLQQREQLIRGSFGLRQKLRGQSTLSGQLLLLIGVHLQ